MRKLHKQTGFTLAELLIVVAIIAILVAIGIPAFSTAMERSRETVDLANIRGAYAEFMAGTMGDQANTGYYKITVKQRDCSKWIIDTTGFLSNIYKSNTDLTNPSSMPVDSTNFKTDTIWVKFTTKGSTSGEIEKPVLSYVANDDTKKAPSGYDASKTVQSGDGWYLTKE